MSSTFWKSVFISPVVLGTTLLFAMGAMAAPQSTGTDQPHLATDTTNDLILNKASGVRPVKVAASEPTPTTTTPAAGAVDSAEVATDIVKPGDWQYTALQNVATKYGCNANLNNQPISQIDFARGLNTCLNRVEPLLAQQPNSVTAGDLEVIKKLTQEYRAQLTEIDARLINADKKIAQAQTNQFSTTTKLKGEAVFNVAGTLSGSDNNNLIFGDRVRLLFESSFSGKDKLWTRIATGNQASLGSTFKVPSTTGAQVIDTNGNNTAGVDWLAYQFPLDNTNVYVAAYNGLQADYAPTFSPLDDFTGSGVGISSFGESSPIYKIGGGTGVGATIPVAETGLASVSVGYFAFGANNPSKDRGVFGTDNSLLGQLNFKLTPQLEGGLTYVNSSHGSGAPAGLFGGAGVTVGTRLANDLAPRTNEKGEDIGVLTGGRTTANSFGLAFVYKASDKLAFNGFAMKSNATRNGTTQDIWSYGGGMAFPDVDGKGSLAGLFVGAEPYVSGAGSTPFHFEGFYKYKLSDNLAITPGLIFLTATDEVNKNSALIGVVRTTFTF